MGGGKENADEDAYYDHLREILRRKLAACRKLALIVLEDPEKAKQLADTVYRVVNDSTDFVDTLISVLADTPMIGDSVNKSIEEIHEYIQNTLVMGTVRALQASHGKNLGEHLATIVINDFPYTTVDSLTKCRSWLIRKMEDLDDDEKRVRLLVFDRLASNLVASSYRFARTAFLLSTVSYRDVEMLREFIEKGADNNLSI